MSDSEHEWIWKRCTSCGDEFRDKKGSNATFYACFACGGEVERIPESEVAADAEITNIDQ